MPLWLWVLLVVVLLLAVGVLADRRARRRGHVPSDGSRDMYDDPAIKHAAPYLGKNRDPGGF
jgi:cytochrome c-type biogenesis protein CcmH/NrfF